MKYDGEKKADTNNKTLTTPNELSNVLFQVPCHNCFEDTLTLPYIANTKHYISCPSCRLKNFVAVDQKGGVSVLSVNEINSRMKELRYVCSKCKKMDVAKVKKRIQNGKIQVTFICTRRECEDLGIQTLEFDVI